MLKIVSDIDDTLMSSGGSFPAGCDRTYPRHCIYPGVLAFYSEMDICQALRVQVRQMQQLLRFWRDQLDVPQPCGKLLK
jgi:hypothetical protein